MAWYSFYETSARLDELLVMTAQYILLNTRSASVAFVKFKSHIDDKGQYCRKK